MSMPVCAVECDEAAAYCIGLVEATSAALIDKQPAAPSKSLQLAGASLVSFGGRIY
jgi:hypothetical protein